MAIKFTIAKRGLLPAEETGIENADEQFLRGLRPRLEHRQTVDAVEFQESEYRLPSMLPQGELLSALNVFRRVMLHEMKKGNAVSLPGIGTFRLSLKGSIEVKEGKESDYYHGHDVHVDDILFEPDRSLLREVRGFEVDQVPYGQAFHVEDEEINARFTELFARQNTITHKDVAYAFEMTLTRTRISSLLRRLVGEGRLIPLGSGAQTRYRAAEGQFGS